MTEHEEELKYIELSNKINELFPNIQLELSSFIDDLDLLNEVFSYEPLIIIKLEKKCYCYDYCNEPNEFIEIRSINGKITYYDLFKQLDAHEFRTICNHRFLEGIEPINKYQYVLCCGS